MPFYRIRSGHQFRDGLDQVRGAGDLIEVPTDIALGHLNALEFVSMRDPGDTAGDPHQLQGGDEGSAPAGPLTDSQAG